MERNRPGIAWIRPAYTVAGFAVLALTLLTAPGCSGVAKEPRDAAVVTPQPAVVATKSVEPTESPDRVQRPDPKEQDRLEAELLVAVRTARPSLSPEGLDAYIRKFTKAQYSLIVAPFRPKDVGGTWVASHGLDAAITDVFEGFIEDSKGRTVRDFDPELVAEPLYFAGRPILVHGRAGYVLVARTAK